MNQPDKPEETLRDKLAREAREREPIMQFFAFEHLPQRLADVSRPFGELAGLIAVNLPAGDERRTALRKLLEANDCAVRAVLQLEEIGK